MADQNDRQNNWNFNDLRPSWRHLEKNRFAWSELGKKKILSLRLILQQAVEIYFLKVMCFSYICSRLIQLYPYIYVVNVSIFHYLELDIALVIPASNDEK